MNKPLLMAGMLTLASLVFASAKTYPIEIESAARAGNVQLAKGDYTVQVEGDKAVFIDQHHKTISVPVKLDAGSGKKFEYTSVETTQKDGTEVIQLIHLGGATTTLEFGD